MSCNNLQWSMVVARRRRCQEHNRAVTGARSGGVGDNNYKLIAVDSSKSMESMSFVVPRLRGYSYAKDGVPVDHQTMCVRLSNIV